MMVFHRVSTMRPLCFHCGFSDFLLECHHVFNLFSPRFHHVFTAISPRSTLVEFHDFLRAKNLTFGVGSDFANFGIYVKRLHLVCE